MEFNYKKTGNVIILYLKGKLDVHYSIFTEQEIIKIISIESASHLLINMKDMEFITSEGIRIIVSTMKKLNDSGRNLVICNINSAIRKLFEVLQMNDLFNIYDSEEEAIEFLNML